MSMIIVLTLVSADITSIIGVHAMCVPAEATADALSFGGFLVGVIIPHERGFAKKLTERMEDFVSCSLVPLYFTLSGALARFRCMYAIAEHALRLGCLELV